MQTLAILAADVLYARETRVIQRTCRRYRLNNSHAKQWSIREARVERYRKHVARVNNFSKEYSKKLLICTTQCWAVDNMFV